MLEKMKLRMLAMTYMTAPLILLCSAVFIVIVILTITAPSQTTLDALLLSGIFTPLAVWGFVEGPRQLSPLERMRAGTLSIVSAILFALFSLFTGHLTTGLCIPLITMVIWGCLIGRKAFADYEAKRRE